MESSTEDYTVFESYLDPVPEGVVEFSTMHPPLLLEEKTLPHLAADTPPQWQRTMPHKVQRYDHKDVDDQIKSIKTCPGVVDYSRLGYVLPVWADMTLERVDVDGKPDPDGMFINGRSHDNSFPFIKDPVGYHTSNQVIGTPLKDCGCPKDPAVHLQDLVKPICPWYIRTAPGWSCLFLDALPWHDPDNPPPLKPVSGVLDTDIWHQAHVPCSWRPGTIKRVMSLRFGTPFVHVIPFKREAIKTKPSFKLIKDSVHFNQLHTPLIAGDAGYRRYQKMARKTDGCPFLHGAETHD